MGSANDSARAKEVVAIAGRRYRKGRATFQLDPKRFALLTIDMQDEFVRRDGRPSGFRKLSASLSAWLA